MSNEREIASTRERCQMNHCCLTCANFYTFIDEGPEERITINGAEYKRALAPDGVAVTTYACTVAERETEDDDDDDTANDAATHMLTGGAKCPYFESFDEDDEEHVIIGGIRVLRAFGDSVIYEGNES